jgi:branched-chain amino acid transport system substrate-binding protein
MSPVSKVLAVAAVLGAWAWALAPATEAQPPLRIGASFSGTGAYAQFGQTVHRGYQLCVKQANERGGILGRRLDFTAEDDRSDTARSVAIYERLLVQAKVDAVFSPYSTPITDAVADLTEKHGKPLAACCMAATPLYRKGRRFVFMFLSPAEAYLEGLVDLAAKRGRRAAGEARRVARPRRRGAG